MERRAAFTLIELLVVIAVIAILAAILFPVFAMAKTSAKKTASMSNMKQVGTASVLYLADYDDTTPPLFYFDQTNLSLPTTRGFYYWGILLMPYTKSEAVLLCPNDRDDDPSLADPQGRGRFDPDNQYHHYIVGANCSYGLNYRYLNQQIMAPDPNGNSPLPYHFVGVSATSLSSPASTVMFGEATMKDLTRPGMGTIRTTIGYARIEPPSRWVGTYPDARSQGQLWPRFNKDLVNIGWLDGHVKATPIRSLRVDSPIVAEMDRFWNGLAD